MVPCRECYGCIEYGRCGSPVESELERRERLELQAWGAGKLQEQEDRTFILQEALKAYVEELGGTGERLGEVASRRLAVARKMLVGR